MVIIHAFIKSYMNYFIIYYNILHNNKFTNYLYVLVVRKNIY